MGIPTNDEILELLYLLDRQNADSLESQTLEFKPWLNDVKENKKIAVEYSVCFANRDGGVIVFGVSDKVIGRRNAIHGAEGYNLDVWQRGIYDDTKPHISVDVEELSVPDGTGRLLIVRIPKGTSPPYSNASRLFESWRSVDPARAA